MLACLVNAIKESYRSNPAAILKQTQIIEIAAECHTLFDLVNENDPSQKPLVVVQYPKSVEMVGINIVMAARDALEFEVISDRMA